MSRETITSRWFRVQLIQLHSEQHKSERGKSERRNFKAISFLIETGFLCFNQDGHGINFPILYQIQLRSITKEPKKTPLINKYKHENTFY